MAVIKLFLRTRNSTRVFPLVDRLELEDQAWKVFAKTLKDDWKKAEIVVFTVQSLSFNNKYQRLFSPTDFDLIISDEAHRSIGGNSRFIGYCMSVSTIVLSVLLLLPSSTVASCIIILFIPTMNSFNVSPFIYDMYLWNNSN